MTTFARQIVLHWIDSAKRESITHYPALDRYAEGLQPAEIAFASTLAAYSGCRLLGVWSHEFYPASLDPIATSHGRLLDRVLFTGEDAEHHPVRVVVPGPSDALFGPDGKSDLTNPAVVEILEAAAAAIATVDGQPVVQWLRGTLGFANVGEDVRPISGP